MSSEDKSANDSFELVVMMFFIFILVVVGYMFLHIYAWHFIKLNLFSVLASIPENIREWVFFYKQDYSAIIPSIAEYLGEHEAVFFEETDEGINRKYVIDGVAKWLVVPYMSLLIGIFLLKGLRTKSGNIKRSKHAMYDYARSQSDIWVYIKHVAYIMEKIVKTTSLREGWYAMSDIPVQWMIDNDLIVVSGKDKRASLTRTEKKDLILNQQKSYTVLKDKLGVVWTGLDNLTQHELEIFSVIVPQLFGQTLESRVQNRLLSLANSSDPSKEGIKEAKEARVKADKYIEEFKEKYRGYFETPYFSTTSFDDPFDPILSSFEEISTEKEMLDKAMGILKKILLTHQYVYTVMIAIYESSWMYGVLAPNEMKWVKKHDRQLWFTVSQCGRRASFVECSAAWSHYVTEKAYGFKMLSPQVYGAIKGFDYEMWKTHDNYIAALGDYDNQERWDKLVPTIETNSKA